MFRKADRSVENEVLSALTVGFSADPFMRWLYPEPHALLKHLPRVMNFFGGRALDHGGAYRNDDFTAAVLWLPPEVHPDEESLVAYFEESVAPEKHAALFATFEQMDKFHPQNPCWHLAFIAVDPSRQGKGVGSALLKASLEQCDADGRPAYLESTNPANLTLYRRFGFEQIGLIETGEAPPLFPMLRQPA
ncbi:GNAT family N-acetyltransferase [Leisingera aquaemixtae]|uniref:GNAT family N-acetyltransferase n=1 Tax=Leisingera aquaemixtae TaxID=1396826 RepID=UPI001C9886CA|nr:GNAT family N-acetyltransferase [Leisingera aquaemixtae]MBY6065186.1 GNAT family N-acetyltransferase [Leisingera aquaemixtae]